MEVRELRIGNYVQSKGRKTRVTLIDVGGFKTWHGYRGNFEPIPLTEEWLIKFGFKYGKIKLTEYGHDLSIEDDEATIEAMENMNLTSHPCKYVHQLQNLYFALTGEELNERR